ncbi:MAG: serine hydrolase domain-containing protein, partial [Anaerolineae bacterium]
MSHYSFDALHAYVERRRQETGNPALAFALTDGKDTIHVDAFGRTDLHGGDAVTGDTVFEIGSVSKTFGAVAALQAVEAGLLDLQAPVTEYLPWFRVRTLYPSPITVHHLLSHSAGLVYSMDTSPDPRGVVWELRNVEVGFAPGEHFYYAEPGYQTLTLILEHVYGKPYAQIVQAGILDPLGMAHSYASITHDLHRYMPRGYRRLYDDRPPHTSHPLVPAVWLEFNSSDGAIASTALDMARFVRMLLNRGRGPDSTVLSEASYKRMSTEVVTGSQYGYGLAIFPHGDNRHIGHSGDMPGYEAYISIDLDNGLGTAILSAQPYPSGLWWDIHDHWRPLAQGQDVPDLPSPVDPACVENAGDYAGTYRAGERACSFVAQGERLYLERGGEHIPLESAGEDRFQAVHPGADLFYWAFGRQETPGDEPGPVVEVAYGSDWYIRDLHGNDRYDGPRAFDYPP